MAGVKGKGGQKGRSGRRPKAEEDELKRLLDRNWPKRKRAEMLKAWSERAANGDLEAGKLLMAYRYGKPVERKEITGEGGEPLMQPIADALVKVYGDDGGDS